MENYRNIKYTVFIDGVQTVLLFSDNQEIIETALNVRINVFSLLIKLFTQFYLIEF